jgi:putative FmdB family regulatory protein
MPLYDYHCPECGDFRAWRRMSEAGDPLDCAACDQPAARLVVAPNLALMPANNRIAHGVNDKSSHEPAVVSKTQMDAAKTAGSGHGHGGHHHHSHGGGGRPWMIGH